jgi:hypothetical protein
MHTKAKAAAGSSTSRMEACHAGVAPHLNQIFEGNYP